MQKVYLREDNNESIKGMKKKQDGFFIISICILFFLGFEIGGFQISLLDLSRSLGVSDLQGGIMVAVKYSALLFMPSIWGKVADRVGKMKILSASCIVFTLGCASLSLCKSYYLVLLCVFMIGTGGSVVESIVAAMLTDYYQEKSGKYMNITQCFFSFGAVVAPQLLEFVKFKWNWNWNFLYLICSGAYFTVSFILLYYIKNGWLKSEPIQRMLCGVEQTSNRKIDRISLYLIAGLLTYGGLEVGITYYLDTFASLEQGGKIVSANMISLFWIAMIPARVMGALLFRYKKQVTLICYIGIIFVLTAISFNKNILLLYFQVALTGICMGPIWPNLISTIAEANHKNSGFITGIACSSCGIGAMVSPVMMGYITQTSGVRQGYLILAIFAAVGSILTGVYFGYMVRRREG